MHPLGDGPFPTWPAKVRRLALAVRAGLPVPSGWVLPLVESRISEIEPLRASLLEGPLIVRSALAGEDEQHASAAGLGRSISNISSLEDLHAALHDLIQHQSDPWLDHYRQTSTGEDHVLIQHQVLAQWMLVLAIDGSTPWVDVHRPSPDPFASGRSPDYAGPLETWPSSARIRVTQLVDDVVRLFADESALDLEVIVDADDRPFLVQVRPLVAPLLTGWEAFRATVEARGEASDLVGDLRLDAEHNPTPLSPAHASLVRWLASVRPNTANVVLAGWLFFRHAVGSSEAEADSDKPPSASIHAQITRLVSDAIPTARAQFEALGVRTRGAQAVTLLEIIPDALEACVHVIDVYAALERPRPSSLAVTAQGLSLSAQRDFIDVLPTAWDIASPSLAEHLPTLPQPSASVLDIAALDTTSAMALLREWDDLLFALGLAPLRAVYLAAANCLSLDQDDVFLLTLDELTAALAHGTVAPQLLMDRKLETQHLAQLHPPPRILHGHPVLDHPRARWRGYPIGDTFEGPLARRTSLEALLSDPPSPAHIVVVPSLTAQAALALHAVGVQAVCCEFGGAMSHAALMARELRLTALIGCRGCMELPNETQVRIDTRLGRLLVRQPIHDLGDLAKSAT